MQITFYSVWLKMVQVHTKINMCRRDLNPELFKYLFNNCTGFMHLWHNIQHVLSQYMSISPFHSFHMYLPGVHFSGSAPLGFERAVGSLQLQRERKRDITFPRMHQQTFRGSVQHTCILTFQHDHFNGQLRM